ncbi:cupin domain-containing protein [Falsihalocynthiibacter sp. SS001]|uniref:cupin domain-containing protein n=1 Tax=Falsihalocynthiibacter sp. SS001 TaxID=3349698 RepID=UPI0036D2B8DE
MTNTYPKVQADTGIQRQVLAENPEMMVVAVDFEQGAIGAAHHHPHLQATYVESGRFVFNVAGKDIEVGVGDSLVVPSNAEHGCRCVEAGRLVDTFTPRRDDFL